MSSRALLALVLASGLSSLPAQNTPFQPHPWIPHHVLVGDEYLPTDVVFGDAAYDNDPWPGGNVFYAFGTGITGWKRDELKRAMSEIAFVCDIRFIESYTASNYVLVTESTDPDVSSSDVGYKGGVQCLEISFNHWTNKFVMIHELMHTLGYRHEQSRPDRDTYVQIIDANIEPGSEHNFEIASDATETGPYDFESVMHYGRFSFTACTSTLPCSANPDPCNQLGCETIIPRAGYCSSGCVMGQRNYMSNLDAEGLVARYGPCTVYPTIVGVAPAVAPLGQAFTLTISGTNFYEGSTQANFGVCGTFAKINGQSLALQTTYVDRTTIQVAVPATLTAYQTCLEVRVVNEYAGDSLPFAIGGVPQTPFVPGTEIYSGAAEFTNLGHAFCSIGDVDGDGKDDPVVGSPNFPAFGNPGSGRVDCFSGADGTVIWSHEFNANEQGGKSLAAAGDWNGDGIQEVIVGKPGLDDGSGMTGEVMVLDGSNGNGVWFAVGRQVPEDRFGFSVASAGDVTGDGLPDVIVGAPGDSRAFLFDATNSVTWLREFYAGGGGAGQPSDNGFAVAGGYDMNGDGVPDQAVGYPAHAANDRGRVRIYSGWTGNPLFTIYGTANGEALGSYLAMLPSVNVPDGGSLLIGAPHDNTGGDDIGHAEIWAAPTTYSSYTKLISFYGTSVGDRFGAAVAYAGDINQDGLGDFLIGAPQTYSGSGGNGNGYARLYRGGDFKLLLEATGGAFQDGFGLNLGAAGDTNGDAVPDVIVGAPFGDPGCDQSGYAQVFHPKVAPVKDKVMISEVHFEEPQAVELVNFGRATAFIDDWRILWHDGTQLHTSEWFSGNTFIPAGGALIAGEEGGFTAFPERPATAPYFPLFFGSGLPTTTDGITVALQTASGIIIDAVSISGASGSLSGPSPRIHGAMMRGQAYRFGSNHVAVERVWGLESNGADWTAQSQTSMGLENRSSGQFNIDSLPVPQVVINEIDDDPDYVEFKNVSGGDVDIKGWSVRGRFTSDEAIERNPWTVSTVIGDCEFFVIGDGPAPAELPPGTPYVDLLAIGATPLGYDHNEFEVVLYDEYGRVVDAVRVQRQDSELVYNDPRAPTRPTDFQGAAYRVTGTQSAIGRNPAGTDTDTGGDWYPLYTRTMGSINPTSAQVGLPGHDDRISVRLNEGLTPGDGLTVIINAGFSKAGYRWTFAFSFEPTLGTGPVFGLGTDALFYWLYLSQTPPWNGYLDSEGSARIDAPPGSVVPGIHTEDIFILQDPATGDVVYMTKVIAWNT